MKALTITQPWTWAIAQGHKRIENRTWRTSHTGLLAIHAGKSWDPDGATAVAAHLPPGVILRSSEIHLGAVLAVATLSGVCSKTVNTARLAPLGEVWCGCGPWAMPGNHHWHLADVRALPEPVACRGAQQLWTLPPIVEAAVRAALTPARTDA